MDLNRSLMIVSQLICHQKNKFDKRQEKSFALGLKYPASKKVYEKTNGMVEKLCKITYFVIVKVSVPGTDGLC